MMLSEQFATHGFVVARGLLDAAQVRRLRDDSTRALERRAVPFGLGTTIPNAAVESPEVAWIFHHEPVLDAVRAALGESDLVFTMEAAVQRNLTGPWHKDLGTHLLPGGYYDCPDPFSRDDCRVVKVAIYLQPHVDGRGLQVRPGSHQHAELDRGDPVTLRTLPGDVVLFDVRLTHRGQVPDGVDRTIASAARALPRSVRQQTIASTRRMVNRVRARPDRLAVFFAFGPDEPMTRTYAHRNLAREHAQTGRAQSILDPVLVGAFRARGVELLEAS